MTRLKLQKAEPLRLEWENILAAVRGQAPLTVTGADGLAVLRIAHTLAAGGVLEGGLVMHGADTPMTGAGEEEPQQPTQVARRGRGGGIGQDRAATGRAYMRRHGYRVIGCDNNPVVVEGINAGQCHVLEEPGLPEMVAGAVRGGMLAATTDTTAAARQADVVVVIVPVIARAVGRGGLRQHRRRDGGGRPRACARAR